MKNSTPNSLAAFHLTVAYDGTNFNGWQIQKPGVRTAQGELESRLQRLFRDPDLRTIGSSRTDAGVHALGQSVSFRVRDPHDFTPESLAYTLNRWLPDDLRVVACRQVDHDFHARHDAIGKTYVYTLVAHPACSPFEVRYAWHISDELHIDRMRRCAQELVGEHDFKAFSANPKREMETTVRTLHAIDIVQAPAHAYLIFNGASFLYKMVRSLVGHLVHAARTAEWQPQHTRAMLKTRERESHVHTAPPQGLFLARVHYQGDEWTDYQPPLPPHAFPSEQLPASIPQKTDAPSLAPTT